MAKKVANKPKSADPSVAPQNQEVPSEDRTALNDKARFDYGIMNAEDMSPQQLKKEMKTIDDQVKVGEKENAQAEKARKEQESSNARVV